MKTILRNTFIYFLFGASVTGSIYKLIYNPEGESITKLIVLNVVMVVIAFILSYLGDRADKFNSNKNS